MPKLHIRAAVEADAALILQFIRELAEYEQLAREVVTTEEDIRSTLFGDRPAAEVLIAEFGGDPAGFALFYQNYSTFLGRPGIYLEDLFIRPRVRRQGYGKALLAAIANLAVERGCGRLEWSVLNWNESAIGFYRRLGALPMDQWTVYRLKGEALERLARGGR